MQFNSYSYLELLFLAVSSFWLLPLQARRWYVLGLSIGFYATWSPLFLLVPLALCIGVFSIVRLSASGWFKGYWYLAGLT